MHPVEINVNKCRLKIDRLVVPASLGLNKEVADGVDGVCMGRGCIHFIPYELLGGKRQRRK